MDNPKEDHATLDPVIVWMQFYDAWAKSWANEMSQAVSSKEYAEYAGRRLASDLDILQQSRQQARDWMTQYLAQIGAPSGAEVHELAARLTRFEMRLDDLEAKVDHALSHSKKPRSAAPTVYYDMGDGGIGG
jgi:hypothetical protein